MNDPERIVKIGPLEFWGRRRSEPNEFTELADAIDHFKRAFRYAAVRDAVKIRWLWRRVMRP